jgi:hypothetical protein
MCPDIRTFPCNEVVLINGIVLNYSPVDIFNLSQEWIDANGRIRLLPASEFQKVPHDLLKVWCHLNARYGIPTLELVEWLKDRIGGRKAIEIGSGNGDLGYHLGIPETDSYCQQFPEVRAFYQLAGQFPTCPLPAVKKYEAIAAIKRARPQVVIGSWITRRFIRGVDIEGKSEASAYGPKEEDILKGCQEYIHIGNLNVHSGKTILVKNHESYWFPWLVSRAEDQSKNIIWIWRK